MDTPEPCPLALEPILKPKVWGGRRLAAYGKPLPENALIGESWEVADLAATAASGGGGGEARSRIARGPLAGKTLHDAITLWRSDLVEAGLLSVGGSFPLLVKYLDAREHLSVQAHPSPDYAASHPGAQLKTECWYVLEAEPGAVIFNGLRPGTRREDLREAIERGRVPEVLEAVPAVAGQCHLLPSGTVHALGAGVLVAEVQSPSDTTFRVYDWEGEYGRAGRELHVEEALACALFEASPAPTALGEASESLLVDTPLFGLGARRLEPGAPVPVSEQPAPIVVLAIDSGLRISGWGGADDPMEVERGRTVVVPAAIAPRVACEALSPGVVLLAGLGRR